MRIAIDIDNTICDTTEFFGKLSEKYDREILKKNNIMNYDKVVPRSDNWSKEELKYFIDNIFNKEVINIPIKEDAKKYINKLKNKGHEIVFITKRGLYEDDKSDTITEDYLKNNNIPYDNLITSTDAKYKHLSDYDFLIDDAILNCEQTLDNTNCRVILLRTRRSTDYSNSKLFIANNWKEIYEFIKKYENI